MIAVAERVGPSVASLRVMRRVRGGQVPAGAGSAVALTPDGFLLTSAHVVGRSATGGRATFADGREARFEVVGRDPLSDLAVLRADDGSSCRPSSATPSAAGGPAGGGDRQPQRPRRVGDRRRGVGARPLAARALAARRAHHRQRDPDRRRAQPGQLRRRAGRLARAAWSASTPPSPASASAWPCPINEATQRVVGSLMRDGRVRRAYLGIAGGPRPVPPQARAAAGSADLHRGRGGGRRQPGRPRRAARRRT